MNIRHIIKNTGALTAATFLSRAIAFIVNIPLARYLGAEGMGLYFAAYAFVNIFSYFNELGVSQLMVQDASRDRRLLPVYFGNALLVKGIAVVVVFLVMLLCLVFMPYGETLCGLIVILGVAMGFNSINQTIYNYYQTRERMAVAAGYQFLQSLLIGLLTLGVIYVTRPGVVAVTVTHLVSYGLVTGLLVLAVRKEVRPVPDVSKLPKMIAGGLPFGVQRAVNSAFPHVSLLVLSALLLVPEGEMGLFGVAQSLVVALVFLPNSFAQSIYPILFKMGADDRVRHQRAMEMVFKILAAVGIPASFFLWLLAPQIIDWLYRDKYAGAAPVFAVLCWYFALECLNYPLGDVMTTMNRQKERAVLQGVSLGLLAGLTLWLQPLYGLVGAAWAVLLVEGFLFAGYYIFIRLKMYPIRIWRQFPTVLGASLVMLGVAYGCKGWHPLLAAALAGAAYMLVLLVLDRDLRGLVKRVVGK
jgi:O-antigen/teichoic acid export membrane protein